MSGGKRPAMGQLGLAASAGSTLVGLVAVGLYLDVEANWAPWGTLAGLALGFVSCITILLRAAKQSNEPPSSP